MDYKNPALTPEERAEDLLSLMTLEEKVAQMDIIRGVEFSEKPHPLYHCAVLPDSEIKTILVSKYPFSPVKRS